MQINQVPFRVLLPQQFWEQANSEEELNQMIEQYFSVGYPNYEIQEIVEDDKYHLAICTRED
ncbi:hypothetical protein CON65_02570 [Bacillus pseudomycoides]|uniref:Uncharacterized protein n=1 Tax=Bacillus pseudomycoides TaxID=64104 RepID=A0AA91VHB1_9BACI|nr:MULTISPECIES: hypothetical protein [Bacillus]PED84335.1 hypothetical protein CON65_02570 [Bacillus pseudomycoides]PEU08676.1 hypothetical protein CN525_25680 [Bacillus sp. AFS014408]PEU15862.1 hypothetical protein CN524_06275 [Bacillus sp. AFS019443]PFW64838.1 hypothetical protein COL20_02285 [Bacillus sp. AFS075034]